MKRRRVGGQTRALQGRFIRTERQLAAGGGFRWMNYPALHAVNKNRQRISGFVSRFDDRVAFQSSQQCHLLAPSAVPKRVCQRLKSGAPTECNAIDILDPDLNPSLWMPRSIGKAPKINRRVRSFAQQNKWIASLR